jgi:solute carrier family 40 (iron-regulated transporter), member 1
MADLVVTQLMQESIVENERGVVNGVQNSLNMLMDMLKFALVIALPQIEIFGIHILISFSFIVAAGMSFTYHCWRVKVNLCLCSPQNDIEQTDATNEKKGNIAVD